MPTWIAIIIIVSVVGGLLIEYQKNKMKMMNKSDQNQQEVDEVRKLVNSLKTRIENLEAIAAGEPDEFNTGAGAGMKEIEIDEMDQAEENKKTVSDIAKKQRSK